MLHMALFGAGLAAVVSAGAPEGETGPLTLSWKDNMLRVAGPTLAGGAVEIWYLEAYCRPGSTDRAWEETVIPHRTRLVEADEDGKLIRLECRLEDGVVVQHTIRAGDGEIDFQVTASNPTSKRSEAHWAQPCIRVDRFVGVPKKSGGEDYLPRCFIFHDGKPAFLPTDPWAKQARYVPGQVWCPAGVPREDVNPRPLSSIVPSNGLIGSLSADGQQVLATAWEPYQELFQGIIVCLHSDFRIGGLEPGDSKQIRGKLYLLPADLDALQRRYERDFPEHVRGSK